MSLPNWTGLFFCIQHDVDYYSNLLFKIYVLFFFHLQHVRSYLLWKAYLPPPIEWIIKKHCRQSQCSAVFLSFSTMFSRYWQPYTLWPTALNIRKTNKQMKNNLHQLVFQFFSSFYLTFCKILTNSSRDQRWMQWKFGIHYVNQTFSEFLFLVM